MFVNIYLFSFCVTSQTMKVEFYQKRLQIKNNVWLLTKFIIIS